MSVKLTGNCSPGTVSPAWARRSMGRRGNPYDNAKAESLMKTLKIEAFPAGYWKHPRTTNVIGSSLEATAKRGSDGLEKHTSGLGIML